jgi:hypothetical protein
VLDAGSKHCRKKIIYDIFWKIYIINDIFGFTWSVQSEAQLGLAGVDRGINPSSIAKSGKAGYR